LFIYSAHDYHIYPLLILLNLNASLTQPLYLSSITLELRQSLCNSTDYYVQVYYKNNRPSDPINPQLMFINGLLNSQVINQNFELFFKGCGELCPLDKFLNIIGNRVAVFPDACI